MAAVWIRHCSRWSVPMVTLTVDMDLQLHVQRLTRWCEHWAAETNVSEAGKGIEPSSTGVRTPLPEPLGDPADDR